MANSLQDAYNQRQNESAQQINQMYDNQLSVQNAQLKGEYDQALSKAQGEREKISPQYQTQANALGARYEQQRRNANLSGMVQGLGSGTGQQQQNALRNQYIQNYGALRGQEAGALTQADQGIADLTQNYNNALVKAQNDVNAKRDEALIKNYDTQRQWYEQNAQNLATNYGQFDNLKGIYGDAQANQMRNVWISQNPEAAFRSGMITAADYKKLTGKSATDGYRSIYQ